MPDDTNVERIRHKYVAIAPHLDERGRRQWAAVEARAIGWGGIAIVAAATGLSDRTVRTGIRELDDPDAIGPGRQRRPGAGRRAKEVMEPELIAALESIVESSTRGDPMTSLRWTCKSTRSIAAELWARGFSVSHTKVSELLHTCGYSLQANRKTIEGAQHPDRNEQFEHINRRIRAYSRTRQPAISVDTKKKEPLGPLKNPGRSYRRKGDPVRVTTHDFPSKELGKAIPYGVYDITNNEAGVTVGISHDTAEFAVTAIQRWWDKLGRTRFPKGKRVLVTADCGGSNSPRTRLWRLELQRLADETGLQIEVCHFPPGTSKWNKIEHRLFCHITRNWQGIPLETLEIVVNLIGNTSTREGLEVHAWLDEGEYPKSQQVTDAQLLDVRIQRHSFHGEWNYTILPNTKLKIR
jgi:transposase